MTHTSISVTSFPVVDYSCYYSGWGFNNPPTNDSHKHDPHKHVFIQFIQLMWLKLNLWIF